ncbi:hypothetical protein [Gemmatimonas sp.]|jgi:hypothetical protein|uniref:hypothetical protein n=1 Tax=Gemmatimonas sp. TaxID=1962908 RepID=UPI0025BC246D|nr:hypothetical protein [Gemmatimonas sp.]MCA2989137.1 hypothetical protein [Gemmatimonas sp.]
MLRDTVMRRTARGEHSRARVVTTMLSAVALSTVVAGCGAGLRDKVVTAMSECVAVRNPLFKAGRPNEALATKLPAAVDSLAAETAYSFGFALYQEAAEAADTQAELTCVLELGSHYAHEDTRAWLTRYTRHPDEPVAALAKQLYEAQLVRIGRAMPASP